MGGDVGIPTQELQIGALDEMVAFAHVEQEDPGGGVVALAI